MASIVVAIITGVVTLVGVIMSNSKSRAVTECGIDFGKLRLVLGDAVDVGTERHTSPGLARPTPFARARF